MKKILFMLSLFFSVLIAGESEDFYFERGYEVGFQKGLLKGQEIALNEAKKIIADYKNSIHAYEIGKYLVEKKKLTAPQIFQKLDADGTMKIVVIPSKIQKELNIEEIFAEFGSLPILTKNNDKFKASKKDFNELNSVYLSKRDDSLSSLPDNVDRNSKITKLRLKKTSRNRDILNSANVAYVENKNNYEVAFFTKQEKRDFCIQFRNLCR